jgi:predicted nuclease with TOPRIM domain
MKRTKAELLDELESMTEEKDILFDKLETANSEIDDLEDEIKELQGKAETLDILIDLIDCYYIAHTRYTMGILTELETIEKLTDKLLDMRTTSI